MKSIVIKSSFILLFSFAAFFNSYANSSFKPNSFVIEVLKDTVPKSKTKKVTIDMSDIDKSLQEIDKAVGQLNKQIQDVDWHKISTDVNTTLSKIDIQKMKEDIKASMKKVDWQRVNGDVKKSLNDADEEIQKAMKIIDNQLNSEKTKARRDELKKELQELKADLQKNKAELQKEVSKTQSSSDY